MSAREKKRNITIKGIAEKAQVSHATVGRVIGGYGKVAESTRKRVLEIVREYNYYPNALAQSLKSKSSKTVGIVIGNIGNEFFSHIVHAMEIAASRAGYNIIVCNTNESVATEVSVLQTLHSKRVDGIILASSQPSDKVFDDDERTLYSGAIPIIYIDREIYNAKQLCVKTDHFGGAYDATRCLIDYGHRDIAVLGGFGISAMEQRLEGYKKALSDNSIEFNEEYVGLGDTLVVADGKRITKDLLTRNSRVTAILALNNLLCMGAIAAIKELHRKIPDEISIIGWDDFPLAEVFEPPLSMVDQDTNKLGMLAMEKLLELIEKGSDFSDSLMERRITLGTELRLRDSCLKLN